MPPKPITTSSGATYEDVFKVFDTTHEWPFTTDEHMGHLMRYASDQFKRVNNGKSPSYGRYGFTPAVQAGFRKRGYVFGSVGRRTPTTLNIIANAIEILSQGEKLSGKVANTLREMGRNGRVPPPDESRLTSLGFRF